jgi:hypothetical protein
MAGKQHTEERRVNIKSRSRSFAAIYFLFMMACYFVFSAMSPPLRHQMASIHSLFWTLALPWAAGCSAVLALGVWFIANLLEKRQRANSQ